MTTVCGMHGIPSNDKAVAIGCVVNLLLRSPEDYVVRFASELADLHRAHAAQPHLRLILDRGASDRSRKSVLPDQSKDRTA